MRRIAVPLAILTTLGAAGWGVWALLAGGPVAEEPAPRASREISWVAKPARFTLRGAVRDAEDRPLGGIRVGVRRVADPRVRPMGQEDRLWVERIEEAREVAAAWERTVDADASGTFEVGVPDEADYEMAALPEDGRLGLRSPGSARPEGPGELDLRVVAPALREGRLLDADGRPVGAVVDGWVAGKPAHRLAPTPTDPETGVFRLRAPEGRGLVLHAVVPGRVAWGFPPVEEDAEGPISLRLPPTDAALEGEVRGPDGRGVPAATVLLGVRPSQAVRDGEEGHALLLLRTDAAGVFRAEGVPQGLLTRLAVFAPGLVRVRPTEEDLVAAAGIRAGRRTRIDVTLAPAASLGGQVLDEATRAPVPGAHVFAHLEHADGDRSWLGTVADEGGTWRIDGLPPGRAVLLASTPDLVSSSLPARVAARDQLLGDVALPTDDVVLVPPGGAAVVRTLTLRPGRTLEGTVLDPQGAPVAGARVRIEDPDLGVPWSLSAREAVTDGGGRFRLTGLPPSPFLLATARQAGRPEAAEPVDATGSVQLPPIVLRFPPGSTVVGVVTDEEGAPLVGAWVRRVRVAPEELIETRTARDGTFRLEGLRAGAVSLDVSHRRYLPSRLEVADLAPGEVREGLGVALRRGVPIRGVFVDGVGEPIAGGHVRLRDEARTVHLRATTDEEGRFLQDGVPIGLLTYHAGRSDVLRRLEANDRDREVEGCATAPSGDLRIQFPADRESRSLEISIVDPGGVPVSQAILSCAARPPGDWRPSWDAPGMETLPVVGGRVRVHFRRGRPAWAAVGFARDGSGAALDAYGPLVALPDEPGDGAEEAPVEIRLTRGVTIGGLVRDEDGRGVPGVLVRSRWHAVITGADGRYLLRGQPAGRHTLRIDPPEGFVEPPSGEVSAGEAVPDTVLRRADCVQGRLLGPADAPVCWGMVRVEWSTAEGRRRGEWAWSEAGGWFRVGGLPREGPVSLQAHVTFGGPRLARAPFRDVRVGARDLVVRLAPAALIEGTVLDAAGRPVNGAWVRARTPAGENLDIQTTDSKGEFRFVELEAGAYDLWVLDGPAGAGAVRVRVRAPASGVVLSPRRPFRCGGTVVGEGDLSGLRVEAVADEAPSTVYGSTRVAADGAFFLRLDGAPPFRLIARGDGDPRYATSDPLRSDAEGLDLVLRPGGGIEGRVRSVSGSLPAGIEVGARGAVWHARVPCDGEGRFRFAGLPRGRYRLEVQVPGRAGEIATAADTGARDVEIAIP